MSNETPRVQKRAPDIAQRPSGVTFNTSSETDKLLAEIEQAARNPVIDEPVGERELDDKLVLDDAFAVMSNPPSLELASRAVRKRVEKNLAPLDIDSLFLRGEIRQEVSFLSGRYKVVFRTLAAKEDLFIKRRLSEVRHETARYVEDRFMVMQLAAHIVSVNGEEMPEMLGTDGDVDTDRFDKRFKRVCDLPVMLIERIWVQWVWFQDRVNKALNSDFLENG